MNQRLSKRDRLAICTQRSGLQRLLGHLPKRRMLLVLNYHRIGDASEALYDPEVFSATEEDFDRQVRFLKNNTECVTLDDVIAFVEQRNAMRGTWSLITLDDGYRDSYERAFPILRSNGVQGVFFLPTAFIGSRALPWWDAIAHMIKSCQKPRLTVRYPYRMEFDLAQRLRSTIRELLSLYKNPVVDRALLMEALEEACGVAPRIEDTERCFISWPEVREMATSGMALGAHSHQHEIMSTLTSDQQYREALESKQAIEGRAGRRVDAFAYPFGTRSSFSTETVAALKRAGYRVGFSFYGGSNSPSDTSAFDIRRCGVDGQMRERFECQVRVAAVTTRFWP